MGKQPTCTMEDDLNVGLGAAECACDVADGKVVMVLHPKGGEVEFPEFSAGSGPDVGTPFPMEQVAGGVAEGG